MAAALAIALALGARRLAGTLARRSMRARLAAGASALGDGVDEAQRLLRTGDPAILAGAAGYMLFDVAMLGVCFAAFGNDVPPVGVLLVAYILGQLGSLIPIPGGIGGVDAGLIGVLVLYGVDATDAAVAVIAYRGLLLFIPAALGLPALAILRRRLRAESHDIAACAPGESVEVLGRGVVRRPEPVVRPPTEKTRSGRPQPEHQLVHVAPAPILARLGRTDDRMPARHVMGGRRDGPASCRNSRCGRTSGTSAGEPSARPRPGIPRNRQPARGARGVLSRRGGCRRPRSHRDSSEPSPAPIRLTVVFEKRARPGAHVVGAHQPGGAPPR